MRQYFSGKTFTLIALAIILLGLTWTQFNMSRWDKRNIIIWDVIGYYSYLPALVYGDMSLEDSLLRADFDYYAWGKDLDKGGKVIQMSSGTAIMYSPFFFTAYLVDLADGSADDLDSPLYHKAISLAAIFWLMLGLVFLSLFLWKYFSDRVTGIVLLLIVLGTNLFYYSTAEPGMSHVYSFALFAVFLWLTDAWQGSRRRIILALITGFVFGLIVLIRPSNIVLGLIILLCAFPGGLKALFSRWYYVPVMALMALIAWMPQLFYWKTVTGTWLYFSYNDSSFFFGNPHIIEGLFSFRKGWLIYTPMMVFAIAGLFLKEMPGRYRLALPVFLAVNTYIIFSWWCWWYGGSYGLRAFIESYALMALPLAALVSRVLESRKTIRLIVLPVLGLLLALNLFQTYQYKKALIHWDSMSRQAYCKVFLKLRFPADYESLLRPPDYENARKGLPEKTK